jgi:L-arabinose isomerase
MAQGFGDVDHGRMTHMIRDMGIDDAASKLADVAAAAYYSGQVTLLVFDGGVRAAAVVPLDLVQAPLAEFGWRIEDLGPAPGSPELHPSN